MSRLPRHITLRLGKLPLYVNLATICTRLRRKGIPLRYQVSRRWQSTDATSASAALASPKILDIVDQISKLTLLETADLISALKTRLNIPELPIGGLAGGAGSASASITTASTPVEEDDPAPKVEEKTLFSLKLQSFDAAAKPKIIKEIKQLLNLSLVDSKKFVESSPKLMKDGVTKDEGEKIIETMKGLGAIVAME